MKKLLSVKTVVAIGIGAALFFVLGKFANMPSYGTEYLHQSAVCHSGGVCHPVRSHCRSADWIYRTYAGGCYSLRPWWSWIIASASVGLIIGVVMMKVDLSDGFDKKKILRFNIAQIAAHLLAWGLIAPCLDILIYAEPVEKLFAQGLMAGIVNMITTGVIGTLLLFAYSKTLTKKGSLNKE